ncbi:unnamed protein product [Lota lota]
MTTQWWVASTLSLQVQWQSGAGQVADYRGHEPTGRMRSGDEPTPGGQRRQSRGLSQTSARGFGSHARHRTGVCSPGRIGQPGPRGGHRRSPGDSNPAPGASGPARLSHR